MPGLTSPLFKAILTEDIQALREALDAGEDPHAVTGWGATPLIVAAERNNAEAVRVLLPVSDPLYKDPDFQWTALQHAMGGGHLESASLLIAASDPLKEDDEGHTPLMRAAAMLSADMTRALLPFSDAKQISWASGGHTALTHAARTEGQSASVAELLPVYDPV